MFGLFKKRTSKVIDNTERIVSDFTLRGPYWDYRPIPYQPYQPFLMYQKELDVFLDELIKKGAVDDGNGDTMTPLLEDMAQLAYADLNKQRIHHKDIITSFEIRLKTDQGHAESELELMETELNRVNEELKDISERCNKEKFTDIGGKANE